MTNYKITNAGHRIWTDKEREILSEMFADNYTETICKILNRSYRSVCSQSFLMGLKKSDAFMKMELKRQAERLKTVGLNGRFKKGSAPLNKGKKMADGTYQKCKQTMFKKGHIPHNTKEKNGVVVIRKDKAGREYQYIRIAPGKWELLHRVKWGKEVGEIQKGMLVVFKDGNTLNCEIENLELISMAQNAIRNKQSFNSLPEDLKKTKSLINKLNKKTNELQYQSS